MQKGVSEKKLRKSQEQQRPGSEKRRRPKPVFGPKPVFDYPEIKGNGKLKNKLPS